MKLKNIINAAPLEGEIQKAILTANNKLMFHKNILCSVSGGADSDIVVDLLERIGTNGKVTYVFFNTGLEYKATKEHIKNLEKNTE